MTNLKIGDIVVSDRNPTCVQRVVKIEPMKISGKVVAGYDLVVSCVTIWRLDAEPISTRPNKPAAAWAYRKATKKELVEALTRLQDLVNSMA
jgi:hypothetical protein